MFHREKNVLVIATKFNTAANLVKKVKTIKTVVVINYPGKKSLKIIKAKKITPVPKRTEGVISAPTLHPKRLRIL